MPELHNWLRAYLKANPQAKHREVSDAAWAFAQRQPATLQHLVENWVECHRPRYEIHTAPGSVAVIKKERAIAKAPGVLRKIERAATAAIVANAGTIFMNLPLPDGTLLCNATFAQCAKAGGWWTLVAKQGKPSEVVGRKLSERDLLNLWKRVHNT